ncbi:hypothetical protein MUK42_32416 [Musa troglodytarum]|uniref:Uncharacterized protein n=1 Tax=Musa troglodytarum TaxID=320322 RepID=A0A9E7FLQ5_9LILI|nr:hypothetical protein MUK42_32416 [Musa troglodytarum]
MSWPHPSGREEPPAAMIGSEQRIYWFRRWKEVQQEQDYDRQDLYEHPEIMIDRTMHLMSSRPTRAAGSKAESAKMSGNRRPSTKKVPKDLISIKVLVIKAIETMIPTLCHRPIRLICTKKIIPFPALIVAQALEGLRYSLKGFISTRRLVLVRMHLQRELPSLEDPGPSEEILTLEAEETDAAAAREAVPLDGSSGWGAFDDAAESAGPPDLSSESAAAERRPSIGKVGSRRRALERNLMARVRSPDSNASLPIRRHFKASSLFPSIAVSDSIKETYTKRIERSLAPKDEKD